MDKTIRYSAYTGIASFVLGFPLIALMLLVMFELVSGLWESVYIIFSLFLLPVGLFYLWGFKLVGIKPGIILCRWQCIYGLFQCYSHKQASC